MLFELQQKNKRLAIYETTLLKLGISPETIPILRNIFKTVKINQQRIKETLENLPPNKTIHSIIPNISAEEKVFEEIASIVFNLLESENDTKVICVFSGYNYNPEEKKLRIYFNRVFLEKFVQCGTYRRAPSTTGTQRGKTKNATR